jgi:protoheme IX farnesyltransferase
LSQLQSSIATSASASGAVDAPVVMGSAAWRADVVKLAKPGIVKMVLITTAVGFTLAAMERGGWPLSVMALAALWCMVGTTLSAAGANALNQAMEFRRDALMRRTMNRPIPAGRMSVSMGAWLGALFALAGVLILWLGTNPVAALVSLATILSYVFIYTPLKPVTPLATLVGAVPGALPPLMGWAAASDGVWRGLEHPGGWSLFALMFVWQVPHFLAIAWKCREDYERGGYRMLPLIDASGARTSWISLLWAVTLIPVSLSTVRAMPDRFGWLFLSVATVVGVGFVISAARLVAQRTDRRARELFFASIIYLPVALLAMVADVLLTAVR